MTKYDYLVISSNVSEFIAHLPACQEVIAPAVMTSLFISRKVEINLRIKELLNPRGKSPVLKGCRIHPGNQLKFRGFFCEIERLPRHEVVEKVTC